MDDLRKRLHEAADAHQPDRDAMWARVEQGMSRSVGDDQAKRYRRRRQASWLKVALAGVAGVGVLGLGGLAVAAGVQQRTPPRPNPPVETTSSQSAAASPKPRPSASRPAPPASPASPSGPSTRHSSAPVVDGPVSASAAVDAHSTVYWEQNDLTLDVKQPLTTFTLELTIAQGAGLQNTGNWQTAPDDDFTISVTQEAGNLVYRWVLKPGRTLPAARQLFSAQFNHATGKRDAGKDTYRVEYTSAGRPGAVHGNFPAGS